MSNALVPINDMKEMARAIAGSGLFGIKTPEQALALMAIAQAEGQHPAIAARDYHIVQGRPALKADAMLARFQQAGGFVKWKSYTDEMVTGVFSHPQGGEVTITWSIDMADRLGFLKKDNWKNYPRAMLRARCISEGIRTVYPACVAGVYTPEEVADFAPPKEVPNLAMEPEPVEDEFTINVLKPDGTIYSRHPDQTKAAQEYFRVVDNINANSRMSTEEKAEKLKAFAAANTHLFPEQVRDDGV